MHHLVMRVEKLLEISAVFFECLTTLLRHGVKGGLDDVILVKVRSVGAINAVLELAEAGGYSSILGKS
jgi:hypothetical protein